MEIKRNADHIIIELNKKRLSVYWNRKFKFGENIIRRICERITVSELDLLVESVELMDRAIRTKSTLSKEEMEKVDTSNRAIAKIFSMQFSAWITKVDVELLKKFIDACYPPVYKMGYPSLKKQFDDRFIGLESETERKLYECSCLEDCILTRSYVAKGVINEFASIFRFSLLSNAKQIFANVLAHPSPEISFMSFCFQVFLNNPTFKDLDKRDFNGVVPDKLRNNLNDLLAKVELLKEAEGIMKAIQIGRDLRSSDYLDRIHLAFKMFKKNNPNLSQDTMQLLADTIDAIEILNGCYPKHSLVGEGWNTMSNADRRQVALDFFAAWDAEMPDDVAFLERSATIAKQIELEKKARVDAEDIAMIGKTQDQLKEEAAEAAELQMVLKDEAGNEVSSIPVCPVPEK